MVDEGREKNSVKMLQKKRPRRVIEFEERKRKKHVNKISQLKMKLKTYGHV